MRPHALLLALLLAASAGELREACVASGRCLDDTPDAPLHLLQQHAVQMGGTKEAGQGTALVSSEQAEHDKEQRSEDEAGHGTLLASSVTSPGKEAQTQAEHDELQRKEDEEYRKDALGFAELLALRAKDDNETSNESLTAEQEEDELATLGLSLNAAGDLAAFVSALVTNLATIVVCLAIFMVLRVHYPLMYSNNAVKENPTAPSRPDPKMMFSWVGASIHAGTEDWIKSVGLDNAMLLEFTHLCMKITGIIGFPMLFIMGTMHLTFGGNAAGPDHMSYLSVGNVKYGNWLYWVHVVIVWAVVIVVKHLVFGAQKNFVKWRFEWLKNLPALRANTVLVGGISRKQQSDSKLKEFFENIFPGPQRIAEAYVVKDTQHLPRLVRSWKAAQEAYIEVTKKEKDTGTPIIIRTIAGRVEAKKSYIASMASLWEEIKEKRSEILENSKELNDSINCTNGFITFSNRADAEVALRLDAISKDQDKWDIQLPPEPKDLLWRDLEQDPTAESGRAVIGYMLLAGLFLSYIPLIVLLTHLAKAVNLGPLQSFWEGLAPTFGLQFMIAFLPTFIILIFRLFFTLKADAFAQMRLQFWYFWFQIFFVILATAVGNDITDFLQSCIESPVAIFRFLGRSMPSATHFYMNFMVLQWSAHAMNLLRYVNLAKFKAFSAIYDDTEAAAKAEPEDQDYYGVGSRSARWTINLTIALVFGSLCPPMYLLVFLNFAFSRVFYGYLIPFAETRKPDTGGFLWVSKLRHIWVALIIYVVMMAGVLYERAPSTLAGWFTAAALIYVLWARNQFEVHFSWEKLPYKYVILKEQKQSTLTLEGHYRQPELFEDYEEIERYMTEEGIAAKAKEA